MAHVPLAPTPSVVWPLFMISASTAKAFGRGCDAELFGQNRLPLCSEAWRCRHFVAALQRSPWDLAKQPWPGCAMSKQFFLDVCQLGLANKVLFAWKDMFSREPGPAERPNSKTIRETLCALCI